MTSTTSQPSETFRSDFPILSQEVNGHPLIYFDNAATTNLGVALTMANGATLGFNASSPEQAQAWHAAGLAAGGTAIEDPPGIREGMGRKLYLAYLRDPDGNKLCALHWM